MVDLILFPMRVGSFIELLLHPAPDAMPHTEETQVMVQIFRVLIVWWRRQSPRKAVSS